jgi:hypothetical protein
VKHNGNNGGKYEGNNNALGDVQSENDRHYSNNNEDRFYIQGQIKFLSWHPILLFQFPKILEESPSLEKLNDDGDNGNDQQNMDDSARVISDKSYGPANDQYNCDDVE